MRMANRYLDKAVYIRETTDGKTRWVKIPGIKIQNGFSEIRVYIEAAEYEKLTTRWAVHDSLNLSVYERKGRAE